MKKCKCMPSKFVLIFVIFMALFGIYFMIKPLMKPEGFVSGECPNTMIKDGDKILLYNPKFAKIPGVNPIKLNSLKDYEEYIEWQRSNKLNCPILHLEKVFDTQGGEMYEIKSSFNTDCGTGGLNHSLPAVVSTPNLGRILNADKDYPPYNQNMFPSYDQYNQDVGHANVIDAALA